MTAWHSISSATNAHLDKRNHLTRATSGRRLRLFYIMGVFLMIILNLLIFIYALMKESTETGENVSGNTDSYFFFFTSLIGIY